MTVPTYAQLLAEQLLLETNYGEGIGAAAAFQVLLAGAAAAGHVAAIEAALLAAQRVNDEQQQQQQQPPRREQSRRQATAKRDDERRQIAYRVRCPYCGSPAGLACLTNSDDPGRVPNQVRRVHAGRYQQGLTRPPATAAALALVGGAAGA